MVTADNHIGIYRPSEGRFYLDWNDDGVWSQNGCTPGPDACLGPWGGPGHLPIIDTNNHIGSYLASVGLWYFDANGNTVFDGCGVDRCAGPFGGPDDEPVMTTAGVLGVFRLTPNHYGEWYFDRYSDGAWNGCGVDFCSQAFPQGFGGPAEHAVGGRPWPG